MTILSAKSSIQSVKDQLYANGLISIIRGAYSLSDIMSLSEALLEGGVKVIEITLNTTNVFEGIAALQKTYGSELQVGAGTVRTAEDVDKAVGAGAAFLIAPCLDLASIEAAKRHDKLFLPGIFTATEAQAAYIAGCETVKLFPAEALGPNYLKALRAPLDHIDFIPTGGINPKTIAEFHQAGAVAFGVGSYLINNSLVQDGAVPPSELAALTQRASSLQQALEAARR